MTADSSRPSGEPVFNAACGKRHEYCAACSGHGTDSHDDGCPCIPFSPPSGEIPEAAVEAVARQMCDAAYQWGDRLHDWRDSGEDVRGTFRTTAFETLSALIAQGWTPPGGTE